jgi:predicted DNA-binding transcriptional regulator YafY
MDAKDAKPPGLGRTCEETKRLSRVLVLIQMIATSPRRYLRRDLAERFEISERMIQKDIEHIRHGLKLSLCHAPEGYYFENMPSLPALRYNFPEALAMLLALQAAIHVSGAPSQELAAATARLESLFPAEFGPFLRQAANNRTASMAGGDRGAHRQGMLTLLTSALVRTQKVRIVYGTGSRGGEVNERVVRPYHLMPYVRSWQLIAFCELRGEVRMFKVDRIQEAVLLDEHYSIPADFDVEDYMGMAWGVMRGGKQEPEDVTLRFKPEAGRWVSEEQWHKSQKVETTADGSVLFRLHIPITPEFVNWVLYYGSRVEVIEPERLRQRVTGEHQKAAAVYTRKVTAR